MESPLSPLKDNRTVKPCSSLKGDRMVNSHSVLKNGRTVDSRSPLKGDRRENLRSVLKDDYMVSSCSPFKDEPMANPRSLRDEQLRQKLLEFASQERKLHHLVLVHLHEVDRRRLYLNLGYKSLFHYCVKELKYSDSAAGRRVSASRLLKDTPEIVEKVETGELNLSNLSQAQSFFRQEEKRTGAKVDAAAKREVFQQMEGKTQEQAKRILFETFPEASPPVKETERPLPNNKTAVTVIIGPELQKKLNRVKELTAHSNDNPSFAELVERLADDYLKHKDPELKKPTRRFTAGRDDSTHRKAIRVTFRNAIYKRAHSQCEHVDPKTGQRCERRYHLQIDHIIPLANGGTNDFANLQLLCRPHNLRKGARGRVISTKGRGGGAHSVREGRGWVRQDLSFGETATGIGRVQGDGLVMDSGN